MSEASLKDHLSGLEYLAGRYREVVEDLRKKAAAQNYPHDLVMAYTSVLRELRKIGGMP
ncbi:MAG: hypothetical protein ACYTHN_08840 [Planctomycetota bacterium]|jgi:hypothetical protein